MGLISAAVGAAGGVLADQWKEYFYCESMPDTLLAVKGRKRVTGRGSNTKGNDNLISSGSVVAVADGQCMLIVEQGKVVEVCAEPGEFVFDASTEPSIFAGGLNKESILAVFAAVGRRIGFGGETAKDQRVYYFNTKELPGFKYGTPGSGIPFRVVDERAGINMSVNIKTHGMYSVRMCNPLLFYTALCGNMADRYERSAIEGQLRAEFLSALQPALARISAKHIMYDELPAYTMELGDALNEVLSNKWRERIGIEVVSVGMESVNASAEDERTIKEMQREAAYMDPTRLAAKLGTAQAQAMTTAAGNRGGAAVGFMGMNMAQNMGGMNPQSLFQMGQQNRQQNQPQAAPAAGQWRCACGAVNSGKFCAECGKPRPADGWTCSCGAVNKGKFCAECGRPKPAGALQYRCDKCGWEPEDPAHPPKFCPQCGDPFDGNDVR